MFNLPKDKTYLLAVSAGSDSMALLAMFLESGYSFVVAHVNYKQRMEADAEQELLTGFCREKKIKLFIKAFDEVKKGNFQQQARYFRYRFFKDLCIQEKIDSIVVAHQYDDVLETFIMQEKRGSIPNYYGIKAEIQLYGLTIYRPLLNYRKQELEVYCQQNKIPYAIDQSNLSDVYLRNRIRKELQFLNQEQRKEIELRMNQKNKQLHNRQVKARQLPDRISIQEYLGLNDPLFYIQSRLLEKVSQKQLMEINRQIISVKQLVYPLKHQVVVKEYGYIEIIPVEPEIYHKVESIEDLLVWKTNHYQIQRTTKNGFYLTKEDFPLVIRSVKDGDVIHKAFGHKRIKRYFIDQKLSFQERMHYPVVLNCRGEIIYAPGLGADINHFKGDLGFFMVKY